MSKSNEPILLIDGAAGIYVPQRFAESYDMAFYHVAAEDAAVLLCGPENEEYWDAWDSVLSYAGLDHPELGRCYLYQDSDLWLVPEDCEFPG